MSVSEACQINDLDHPARSAPWSRLVSEACQINDLDHDLKPNTILLEVSEACQINDLDHIRSRLQSARRSFRSLSDQ